MEAKVTDTEDFDYLKERSGTDYALVVLLQRLRRVCEITPRRGHLVEQCNKAIDELTSARAYYNR